MGGGLFNLRREHMFWNHWVALGSVLGGLSVVLGAFASHTLRTKIAPDQLAVMETAVRYQMYHALALLGVGFASIKVDSVILKLSGICFVAGTLLFSGSLYLITLFGQKWAGPVTPVGGSLLLIGWVLLTVTALRYSIR